jgi:hypothetical protein
LIDQVPLCEVFLDLRKAHDTVNQDWALGILEKHGVGPRALRLLRNFWDKQKVVPRSGGCCGKAIGAARGSPRGTLSPQRSSTLWWMPSRITG